MGKMMIFYKITQGQEWTKWVVTLSATTNSNSEWTWTRRLSKWPPKYTQQSQFMSETDGRNGDTLTCISLSSCHKAGQRDFTKLQTEAFEIGLLFVFYPLYCPLLHFHYHPSSSSEIVVALTVQLTIIVLFSTARCFSIN
jgi:hypothetical protein